MKNNKKFILLISLIIITLLVLFKFVFFKIEDKNSLILSVYQKESETYKDYLPLNKLTIDDSKYKIIPNISRGFFRYNIKGELVNDAVESYTIDQKEQEQVWTIKLKDNLYWYNNKGEKTRKINAYDFYNGIEQTINNKSIDAGVFLKNVIKGYAINKLDEGVKVIDNNTIQFTVFGHNTEFKEILALNLFLPINKQNTAETSGPYYLAKDNKNELVLKYNKEYDIISPKFTTIIYKKMSLNTELYKQDKKKLYNKADFYQINDNSYSYKKYIENKIDNNNLVITSNINNLTNFGITFNMKDTTFKVPEDIMRDFHDYDNNNIYNTMLAKNDIEFRKAVGYLFRNELLSEKNIKVSNTISNNYNYNFDNYLKNINIEEKTALDAIEMIKKSSIKNNYFLPVQLSIFHDTGSEEDAKILTNLVNKINEKYSDILNISYLYNDINISQTERIKYIKDNQFYDIYALRAWQFDYNSPYNLLIELTAAGVFNQKINITTISKEEQNYIDLIDQASQESNQQEKYKKYAMGEEYYLKNLNYFTPLYAHNHDSKFVYSDKVLAFKDLNLEGISIYEIK